MKKPKPPDKPLPPVKPIKIGVYDGPLRPPVGQDPRGHWVRAPLPGSPRYWGR